jgi:ATP-dependent DNA helicase RecG
MDQQKLGALLNDLRVHGADHFTCEVKRAKGGMPVTLWESISAFSNAAGGCIVLGVDEKSDFTVTGVDDPAAMEAQIGAICAEMEPPVRAEIRTVRYEDRNVIICDVPPLARDQRPSHRRALGPWAGSRIRVADGDRKLTDYEVGVLLANRAGHRYDLAPVPGATVEDLNPALVSAYLQRVRDIKREIFSRLDDQRALRMLNVITVADDRIVPTLAGLLAFGIYPQQFVPQLNLTFVAYPATEPGAVGRFGERFIDNRSIDGPIPLMVTECIHVLKRNMRRRSIVSGMYRVDEWEYPEEALREALVNALVHRDYSEPARGMQVQVEMYPDRLLIRNPGGLHGPVELGSLGAEPVTSSRNQSLLKILEDTPLGDGHMVCENRGTGIARMLIALGEAGMEPPRFVDAISKFTVEFPNHALLDEDAIAWLSSLALPPMSRSQMAALVMMHNGMVLTNSSYRASTGVQDSRAATRELKELVDAGVVEQTGTRGSTTYQLSRSAVSPTGDEKGAPGRSRTRNEEMIMRALAGSSMTRSELEEATGLTRDQLFYALRALRSKNLVSLSGKAQSRLARWAAGPGDHP